MTEMFGEAWSPMSVPDLAPDDDDDLCVLSVGRHVIIGMQKKNNLLIANVHAQTQPNLGSQLDWSCSFTILAEEYKISEAFYP